MVGSIISTYMMFLPETTKWFCLIGLAIFFFGIYVPYDKYKRKKKNRKDSPKNQKRQTIITRKTADVQRKQVEQLETLRNAGLLSEEEFREKKRELR